MALALVTSWRMGPICGLWEYPTLRRTDGLRRSARGLLRFREATSAKCPDVSLVFRSTVMVTVHCAWRFRRANSTSVGTRPLRTSAPRRCCWPLWRGCTRCRHGPRRHPCHRTGHPRPDPSFRSRSFQARVHDRNRTYFDTVVVHTGKHTDAVPGNPKTWTYQSSPHRRAGRRVGVSIGETTSGEDLHQLLNVFAAVAGKAYAGPTVPFGGRYRRRSFPPFRLSPRTRSSTNTIQTWKCFAISPPWRTRTFRSNPR